jgi:hypothetical protein
MYMPFSEFDEFKRAGCPCPECGKSMEQRFYACNFSFPDKITDKGPEPTSKRGLRQLMEKRYAKRNKRLESMPPFWKRRMEKFFSQHGIKKTPPSSPDHS